jgi:hypothetical protein
MHHLDGCINSTRCTLELANVRYFSRGLVEPLNYKYPSTPLIFSHSLRPLGYEIPLVNVFCEVCDLFGANGEKVLEILLQGGNIVCLYVVMLLKCCLVLLVVALA